MSSSQAQSAAVKPQEAPAATDKKTASVSPFDRLPVKVAFGAPPPNSPYHTQRAADARANARTYLSAETIAEAQEALVEAGLRRANGKVEDVADHNALTLAAALTYAEHGMYVADAHGLFSDGTLTRSKERGGCKAPRGAKWQERATTDAEEIVNFWTGRGEYPENAKGEIHKYARVSAPRNVSIVFKPGCKFFAFDVDGEKGQESLAALEAEHGALPATWTSLSGSQSGFHMIFRTSESILNTASAIAPGIDIRGEDGQIIAPPSVHPTFGFYEWEEGRAPGEVEIADAPEWLVKLALESSKKTQAARGRRNRPAGQAASKVYEPKDPTGDIAGFEAILETIGDHAEGFDKPIYRAACSYFGAHGWDADSVPLFDQLQEAILAAPCDDNRNEDRYAATEYLENRIEQARDYIAAAQAEEEDLFDEDAGHLTEPGEEGPASAGASAAQSGEFEPVADWLPKKKYTVIDGTIFRKAKGENPPVPICGAFDVVGRSSNVDGTEAAGIIMSFRNKNGVTIEKTIPRVDIMTDGNAVIATLADADMVIAGRGKAANDLLLDLLHDITPQRQIPMVPSPGWTRDRADRVSGFMCPTGQYIPVQPGTVRLNSDARVKDCDVMGTFGGWQDAVHAAMDVKENFYWSVGVATGFAGPIMQLMRIDPVGLYYTGESGQGKSEAARMAVTPWTTCAVKKGLFRTMDATNNAGEDLAVMGTATVCAMDEVGAMKRPQDLPSLLFGLSSGAGKDRKKGRGAGLADTAAFCPFFLFTSERSMREVIEGAGGNYLNGLGRRFPTIDTNAGIKIDDDKLAKVKAHGANFGHAGPLFVRWLIAEGYHENPQRLHKRRDELTATLVGETGSNRLKEAGAVFALVALAGELAQKAGIIHRDVFPAVKRAYEAFKGTDEGEGLEGDGKVLSEFRAWLATEMGITVQKADAFIDPDARPQYRAAVGWYTNEKFILVWDKLNTLPQGINGTRASLMKALNAIGAIEKSGTNNAHTSLPDEVETAGGGVRKVANVRIMWDKLEL